MLYSIVGQKVYFWKIGDKKPKVKDSIVGQKCILHITQIKDYKNCNIGI